MDSPDQNEESVALLRRLRKRKMLLQGEITSLKTELQDVEAELETLSYQDDDSKSKIKLLAQGKKKFNTDPESGLKWMFERNLLNPTSMEVAEWLYEGATKNKGVSKKAIGDYLGLNDPFALEVLKNFCELHHITETHIVDSLRVFLASFRLPGESQKIDRIIERFSEHYTISNPHAFKAADVCYVIAYSCIMLNTLLHNPNVKDKPTFERFVSMNKHFIESGDIQQNLLANIYDSIKQQEFKMPSDSTGTLADNADYEGWLYKQSSKFLSGPLSWKRRWFILADNCLYYFDTVQQKDPRGIIPLQNVGIKRIENPSRPHTFEIYSINQDERVKACKTESDGRLVEGRHSVYRISAGTGDELNGWMDAISKAIQTYPAAKAAH